MSIDMMSAMQGYGDLSASMRTKPQDPSGSPASRFAEVFDKADAAAQGFASGTADAQSVVEAISQAEMALQTAVTLRDRIVGAYQEILRMPL